MSRYKVALWRKRFLDLGLEGLIHDATRPSRPRTVDRHQIIRQTTQTAIPCDPLEHTQFGSRPENQPGGTRMATHGLKPHRVEDLQAQPRSSGSRKLEDIVGLYLNPPQHALVFSADEKSQIQALQRSQPGLPLKPAEARP